jgi:hypothetical protein
MDISIDLKMEEQDFIQACVNNERWAQRKLYEDNFGSLIGVGLRYANNRLYLPG